MVNALCDGNLPIHPLRGAATPISSDRFMADGVHEGRIGRNKPIRF